MIVGDGNEAVVFLVDFLDYVAALSDDASNFFGVDDQGNELASEDGLVGFKENSLKMVCADRAEYFFWGNGSGSRFDLGPPPRFVSEGMAGLINKGSSLDGGSSVAAAGAGTSPG